ncbi:hypothetical protein DFP92_109152 [Yoonia sediminilitoris]|uniref:Uncharacterized protein n=1 Tax=Yoonia sediminilitoris TaxID=1286148 RepID=A0A2T6KD08_9RHOB|nr:hypothetical protein C8N45_109152 [Yoonia sediminilitoris]RCW94320.1 hypothetical protein DFP92_109152 [Yoonia sediminilitoris]
MVAGTDRRSPTFTAQMAIPKNWHVTFRIVAKNSSHAAVVHCEALFSRLIGRSMNAQTTLNS